jgi:hypothetical protein
MLWVWALASILTVLVVLGLGRCVWPEPPAHHASSQTANPRTDGDSHHPTNPEGAHDGPHRSRGSDEGARSKVRDVGGRGPLEPLPASAPEIRLAPTELENVRQRLEQSAVEARLAAYAAGDKLGVDCSTRDYRRFLDFWVRAYQLAAATRNLAQGRYRCADMIYLDRPLPGEDARLSYRTNAILVDDRGRQSDVTVIVDIDPAAELDLLALMDGRASALQAELEEELRVFVSLPREERCARIQAHDAARVALRAHAEGRVRLNPLELGAKNEQLIRGEFAIDREHCTLRPRFAR